MPKVVGVKFFKKGLEYGKVYYFAVGDLTFKKGFELVVETNEGEELVKSVTEICDINKSKVIEPLKNIARLATPEDRRNHTLNVKEQSKVLANVKLIVEKTNPEMNVIDAEYSLNRKRLLISFVSDGRVDFRNLVKELAAKYRTRIELRQVGVRDEAKVIGGIGMCGRIICCNSYLTQFETVSINMAKNQSLSLVPSKISGICGRLLCCLRYEDEEYKRLKQGLPKLGQKYKTSEGEGKVISHNVLLKTFKVLVKGKGIVEIDGNNIK